MPTLVVIVLLVVAGAWLSLLILLHATQDRREPQMLDTSIPFFGPIIGYAKYSVKYLIKLRDEHHLPICTLRMPFSRIYVVNQPSLIQAVQRHASTVSFDNVGRDFGFLFSGLTQESQALLKKAYEGDGNGFTSLVHLYLKDGPFLRVASRQTVEGITREVPNWGYHGLPLDLFDTVRHTLTIALTNTVYGPNNPFLDPEVEAAWLKFLPAISHLMYNPFASFSARKNLQARGKVIAAFEQYFETDGHLQGSRMIQDMYAANRHHGLNITESAKMEIATSLALLSSGSITAIWFILHIISSPAILASVRAEILANITTKDPESHAQTIDVSEIKNKCPTMMAVLQETMRHHSTVMSAKAISQDVVLQDTYLLKKGAMLMIPGPVVHSDSSIWGANVTSFDHHRFLDSKKKTVSTSSYRPFGSGQSMCPGRHFSTNAILGLTAMIVTQFDVEPVGTDGKWVMPTTEGADLWNAMPKLDHDVSVTIQPREEMLGVDCSFIWGGDIEAEKARQRRRVDSLDPHNVEG